MGARMGMQVHPKKQPQGTNRQKIQQANQELTMSNGPNYNNNNNESRG